MALRRTLILHFLGLILLAPTAWAQGAIWFEDLPREGRALEPKAMEALVRWVGAKLAGQESQPPEVLDGDLLSRAVFISISDGTTPAVVVCGTGRGVVPAARDACRKLSQTPGKPRWIKVDVVTDVTPLEPGGASLDVEPSLEGVAFDAQSRLALLPEELVAQSLVFRGGAIRRTPLQDYARQRQAVDPSVRLLSAVPAFRFTSQSGFTDGTVYLPMYRGHRLVSGYAAAELLEAAKLAGDYLARTLQTDGRFLYEYHPLQGPTPAEYNMLRHAGTAYSLAELYAATGEQRYRAALDKSIKYLLSCTAPETVRGEEVLALLDQGTEMKLGGNALAIVALCEQAKVTGDKSRLPLIRKLGRWIVAHQDERGQFTAHKLERGKAAEFESIYYPGEAILGLLRLHQIDPDPMWLDAADKAARYLITVRDAGLSDDALPHDHWLLYGLNELYRLRKDELFLNHAMRLAAVIDAAQIRVPMYADWLGGFGRPPRSNPTATRTEGLCAAYALAQDFGPARQAEQIRRTIQLAVRFQLQCQWREESVMYFPEPVQALGGFHETLIDLDTRIDHVQHNLSALLAARRLLLSTSGDAAAD